MQIRVPPNVHEATSGQWRRPTRAGLGNWNGGSTSVLVQTQCREVVSRRTRRTVMRACGNQNSEMPTDLMSCRAERFQRPQKKAFDAEVKSGFLVLLGPGGMRQDVRVVVYRTSLEHFAVIYPRKRLSKPLGVVNLRNTTAERVQSNGGFFVRQKGYDNTISAKFLCPEREIDAWLSAFTANASPSCHHHASLPVLVETEES
ncbi:unnamed protein product, partial [Iphiclides podalirius]